MKKIRVFILTACLMGFFIILGPPVIGSEPPEPTPTPSVEVTPTPTPTPTPTDPQFMNTTTNIKASVVIMEASMRWGIKIYPAIYAVQIVGLIIRYV